MVASSPANEIARTTELVSFPQEDVVELSLLLPSWQAEALATAADGQGLTTGQVLRGLIREFCARSQRLRLLNELRHAALPNECRS